MELVSCQPTDDFPASLPKTRGVEDKYGFYIIWTERANLYIGLALYT